MSHGSAKLLAGGLAIALAGSALATFDSASAQARKSKQDGTTRMCLQADRQCSKGSAAACRKWEGQCTDGKTKRRPGRPVADH